MNNAIEKELEELHAPYDYEFICGCEIRTYQDCDCEESRIHIIPCQKHLDHLFTTIQHELKDLAGRKINDSLY